MQHQERKKERNQADSSKRKIGVNLDKKQQVVLQHKMLP